MSNPDVVREATEKVVWDHAVKIAWDGASNPVAVAKTIGSDAQLMLHAGFSQGEMRAHPAMQAMVAHLNFMFGQGIGPESDIMTKLAVKAAAQLPSMT